MKRLSAFLAVLLFAIPAYSATTIVTRASKGSALTHGEMDANFVNLKTTADAAQPGDADLTTFAGITPSANVITLLSAADWTAIRSALSLGTAALVNTGTTIGTVPVATDDGAGNPVITISGIDVPTGSAITVGGTALDVGDLTDTGGLLGASALADLSDWPAVSATEVSYLAGVNSSIQGQITALAARVTTLENQFASFAETLAVASVSPISWDYGTVEVGGTPGSKTFTLTNLGGVSLTPTTSLVGTDAAEYAISADACDSQTIVADGTCDITVTFTPDPAATYDDAALCIASNDPTSPLDIPLTGVGSAASSYILEENAEGVGTPTDWVDVAGSQLSWDYATSPAPLVGAQSLYTNKNATSSYTTSPTFTATDTVSFYATVHTLSLASSVNIIQVLDASNNVLAYAYPWSVGTNNTVILNHGTTAIQTANQSFVVGNTYHVWVDYTKGTGANGAASITISSSAVKSEGVTASITTGTSTAQASKIRIGSITGTGTNKLIWDKIRGATTTIGDNPL